MKQFDIEAYLEGGLDANEQAAFEKEISENNELAQEVKLQQMLSGDLKTQLLREHVASALSEDVIVTEGAHNQYGDLPRTIIGSLAVLAVAISFLFFFNKKETVEAPATPTITQTEETPPTETPIPPTIEEEAKVPVIGTVPPEKQNPIKPSKKKSQPTKQKPPVKNRPIAEAQPLPDLRPPSHPSPQVRGSNEENAERKALLDAVWYTDFPPANAAFDAPLDKAFGLLKERDFTSAYVRLQMLERKMPDNDSLLFLKGYTLLEMGEGVEAFNYFTKINELPTDWQGHIEWYKGLSYLLADDKTQATSVFENIKGQGKHLFQKESAKALELLH